MQLFPRQDVVGTIEFWQLCTAVAVFFIFPVSSQLKTVTIRVRDIEPFLWILSASAIVSVVGPVATTVWMGQFPGMQSIEASALYVLALVVQLYQLWPCTPSTTDEETKLDWNGYFCAWVAMAFWDVLATIKLFVMPQSTQELAASAVIVSLQCCLTTALFVVFAWPVSRRIRLPDAEVAAPPASATSASPLKPSVADEIRMAGGLWQWAKQFHVFKDWIWPSDMPWLWLRITAALLLLLCETGLTLYKPRVQGAFFNSLAELSQGESLNKVWTSLTMLTIVTLFSSSAGLPRVRRLLWYEFRLRREQLARTRIFEHLMNNEASFHDTADTAEIRTAIDRGASICSALDFLVLQALPELVTLVGTAVAVLSIYGPHIAFVLGYVIVLNVLVTLRESRTLLPLHDAQIQVRQQTEQRRQSALRFWTTVAVHGQIDGETHTYATGVGTLMEQLWRFYVLGVLFSSASDLPATLGRHAATALVVLQGHRSGGTRLLKDLYTADRLRRILERKSKMVYGENELRVTEGRVEIKGVTFYYSSPDSKPVFQGLDLVLEPGKTTAVVGSSGVGKSTLLNLIMRLYDATTGSIKIDGQDVRTLKRGELSRYIGYMGQTPQIFNISMKENIRFGWSSATDADVCDAAERAGLHSDIMAMSNQYDTLAGEDGRTLSGGQRQRLELARAILKKPRILLLDEPTSSQDANREAHFKQTLDETLNCTRLVVAHRLSSIRNADHIVVLQMVDNIAQVVETGTHSQLVARGDAYATLWKNFIGGADGAVSGATE